VVGQGASGGLLLDWHRLAGLASWSLFVCIAFCELLCCGPYQPAVPYIAAKIFLSTPNAIRKLKAFGKL
jgi:hypothetical protein